MAKQNIKNHNDDDILFNDADDNLNLDMDDDIEVVFGDNEEDDVPEENADADSESGAELARRIQEAEDRALAAEERAKNQEEKSRKEEKARIEYQVAYAESEEKNLTKDIADLNRQLAEAEEEGNTAEKLKLQEKLDEAKTNREKIRTAGQSMQSKLANLDKEYAEADNKKKQAQTEDQNKIEPEAQNWINRNAWFLKPATDEQVLKAHYAKTLYDQMLNEGKRPNTKSFYDEIDRRVKEKMSAKSSNDKGGNRKSGRANPAPSGDEGKKATNKNQVSIGPDDKRIMNEVGLNWRDETHVKEYAKHKRAAQNGEEGKWRYPVGG
jgi:DNA repair exonuclease SbcCD ATPase subunit